MTNSKTLLKTFVLALLLLAASPALALTTVSMSPATVNVETGDVFAVSVTANPQGIKNYTLKLVLSYPAELIEVTNFSLAGGLAVTQPKYDLVDNVAGKLIKTAGYPGGFDTLQTFGTVTFRAKTSGSGVIKVGTDVAAYDASSQNVFTGEFAEVDVAVSAPAPAPEPEEKDIPVAEEEGEELPAALVLPGEGEETGEATTTGTTSPDLAKASFLAGIGEIMMLGTNNALVGVLVGVIILAILIYAIYYLFFRKEQ